MELRAARYALVDEPFVERLLQSPGFQWDGILAIDHVGSFDELTVCVRQWFDSVENESHFCAPTVMPFILLLTVLV